jgi:hypothetical protein
MAKFTKTQPLMPHGRHQAEFKGLENHTHHTFGPGYRWWFRIASGPHEGCESAKLTGTDWVPGKPLDELIEQINGAKLDPGAEFDPDKFVGKLFEVVVGTDGKIAKVTPLPPSKAK